MERKISSTNLVAAVCRVVIYIYIYSNKQDNEMCYDGIRIKLAFNKAKNGNKRDFVRHSSGDLVGENEHSNSQDIDLSTKHEPNN